MAFYIFPNAISKENSKIYLDYCLANSNFEDANVVNAGFSTVIDEKDDLENPARSRIDIKTRKTAVSFITDKENKMNEIVWGFIRQANAEFFNYDLEYFQAIQFARYQDGELVIEGQQIDIGGDKYKVFCRKHYRKLTDLI